MNPLDAHTPAALFGDAARDARELKRAYARLIRVHGPEDAPEVFQHVRRLYEEALAALERASLAGASAGDSGARGADTPAETSPEAEGAWVDERLADLERVGLAEVLPALEERARAGSRPALVAAAALLDASEPDRLVPFLVSLVGEPALSGAVGRVAQLALVERPALVDAPGWASLAERCAEAAARVALLGTEVNAYLALERPDAAWERWEAVGDEIRAADTGRWSMLTVRVLRLAGPGRPSEQLDRWIDRFGSAELGLADPVAEGLCRAACDAMALGAARADGAVSKALLDQLAELLLAEPLGRAAMLSAFGADPARRLELERLVERHPGVYGLVLRVLSTLNMREQALAAWRDAGAPEPHPPVDIRPIVAGFEADLADQEEARQAEWATFRKRNRRTNALVLGVFGSLLLGGWLIQYDAHALGGLLMFGFGGAAYASSRGVIRPDTAERLGLGPTFTFPKLAAAILGACRAQGVWIHEAAAAARGDRRLHASFDALLADPLSDLAVMGAGHTRRAAGPWRRPDAEPAAPATPAAPSSAPSPAPSSGGAA